MSTKALDKIKALRRTSAALASFHEDYAEKYAGEPRYDKKGFGFGRDDRFAAFKLNTHFASWSGVYGDSSCARILSVDGDLVQPYLVQALNNLQRELFAEVARLMREDAAKLSADAEAEIEALRKLLADAVAAVEQTADAEAA